MVVRPPAKLNPEQPAPPQLQPLQSAPLPAETGSERHYMERSVMTETSIQMTGVTIVMLKSFGNAILPVPQFAMASVATSCSKEERTARMETFLILMAAAPTAETSSAGPRLFLLQIHMSMETSAPMSPYVMTATESLEKSAMPEPVSDASQTAWARSPATHAQEAGLPGQTPALIYARIQYSEFLHSLAGNVRRQMSVRLTAEMVFIQILSNAKMVTNSHLMDVQIDAFLNLDGYEIMIL